MIRIDSSWSALPQAPNIIAPRQSGLTFTPVRPRFAVLHPPGLPRRGVPCRGSPRSRGAMNLLAHERGPGDRHRDRGRRRPAGLDRWPGGSYEATASSSRRRRDGSPDDRLDRRRRDLRTGRRAPLSCRGRARPSAATRARLGDRLGNIHGGALRPRQPDPARCPRSGRVPARARSRQRAIPYPILLVLGGLGLALVPGMPTDRARPGAGLRRLPAAAPLRHGATSRRCASCARTSAPISLLAFGLVLVTTVVVAWVAHAVIPGLDWPTAFVLGAIVSPTDPTAATAIAERVGLPRQPRRADRRREPAERRHRAGRLPRGGRSPSSAGASRWPRRPAASSSPSSAGSRSASPPATLVRQVRRRLDDPPLELTISLLTGYIAFLPAQALGVSGVLAAVTVGIYIGWHTPELTNSQTASRGRRSGRSSSSSSTPCCSCWSASSCRAIVDALLRLLGRRAASAGPCSSRVTVTGVRFAWIFATARAAGPAAADGRGVAGGRASSSAGRACAAPSRSPRRSPSR